MILCKELNREFADKKAMFAALIANKELIVNAKKAVIKFSDPIDFYLPVNEQTKSLATKADEPITLGSTIYPVINTTNFLDSHGDVHLNGIWNNSIADNKNKLYYIINHELELGKVISYPSETEAMVKTFNWSDLGLPYIGTTEALIYQTVLTEKSNKDAAQAIMAREAIQNSVRMQYVKMQLAINDTDPNYKEEYAAFTKYYPVIANKEQALEAGYFWAIQEAKILKEGSAVLFGSNSATPILYSLNPQSSSGKTDPVKTSQKINTIFDYLN